MKFKELLDEEDRRALEMLNNRPHGSVRRRGQSEPVKATGREMQTLARTAPRGP